MVVENQNLKNTLLTSPQIQSKDNEKRKSQRNQRKKTTKLKIQPIAILRKTLNIAKKKLSNNKKKHKKVKQRNIIRREKVAEKAPLCILTNYHFFDETAESHKHNQQSSH